MHDVDELDTAEPYDGTTPLRIAWYGRVASPRSAVAMLRWQRSLFVRQVPAPATVVASYCDVGPGWPAVSLEADALGELEWRDGGLAELLAEAGGEGCRFNAVGVRRLSRLASTDGYVAALRAALDEAGLVLTVPVGE